MTPLTRHPFYKLDVLAVLVLALEAHVDPALYAAVGGLATSAGGWVRGVRGCARLCGGHEAPPRGPGPGVLEHLRDHLCI